MECRVIDMCRRRVDDFEECGCEMKVVPGKVESW